VARPHPNRASLDAVVVADEQHEATAVIAVDGPLGYNDGVGEPPQEQAHRDGLPGEKIGAWVGHQGTHRHPSGGRVDRAADRHDASDPIVDLATSLHDHGDDRRFAVGVVERGGLGRVEVERSVDRVELDDRRKPISHADEVADVDRVRLDAAVDRCAQSRVGEVELGALGLGPALAHPGGCRVALGPGASEPGGAVRIDLAVAHREIGPRERGLGELERSGGLLERGFVGVGLQEEQDAVLLDLGAVLEGALEEVSLRARVDVDTGGRLEAGRVVRQLRYRAARGGGDVDLARPEPRLAGVAAEQRHGEEHRRCQGLDALHPFAYELDPRWVAAIRTAKRPSGEERRGRKIVQVSRRRDATPGDAFVVWAR